MKRALRDRHPLALHETYPWARHYILPLVIVLSMACSSCKNDGNLEDINYDPVSYELVLPETMPAYPQMEVPTDNQLTIDGVALGRALFYDPILSKDKTKACASCHLPAGSFTDNLAVSPGVDGITGERSAMSLLDIGFMLDGLFWDGRVQTLEDQALLPVEDPIELQHQWPDVEKLLQEHPEYPELFRKAFGIKETNEIDRFLAAKALAQFQRSLVSSGQSKYDRVQAGRDVFEDDEKLGFDIFFDADPFLPDGQCFHCHAAPLFTTNEYLNNGLDLAENFEDFNDLGRGSFTGQASHNGQFRTPTLRNIEFTAPYMHDGRFETLEEVMDHYVSGGQFPSKGKSTLMDSIALNTEQKMAVIAFLKTLSDTTFMNDPRYADPR